MASLKRLFRRSQSGVYMLELIVALAASGLVAAALVANMAETERFSTSSQNQILAAAIAQQQIDNTRNTSYSQLALWQGTHTLLVNRTQPGEAGPPVNPRPLLMDELNLSWSKPASTNKFVGAVEELIEPGPYPSTLKVTVTSSWQEGQATRSYSLSTLVSQYGLHN